LIKQPKLAPKVNGCKISKELGYCKDYFYEDIDNFNWNSGKFKIVLKNKDIIEFNIPNKLDTKILVEALKANLRDLNKQRYFRVVDDYKKEQL